MIFTFIVISLSKPIFFESSFFSELRQLEYCTVRILFFEMLEIALIGYVL